MEKKITYTKAMEQLEALIQEIESGNLTIEQLESKVKSATQLIRFCKDKLHKTDQELTDILTDLE